MRLVRGRIRPWIALVVALAVAGLVVLDGTAAALALGAAAVALFVAAMRYLRDADLSGVTHGGEGG